MSLTHNGGNLVNLASGALLDIDMSLLSADYTITISGCYISYLNGADQASCYNFLKWRRLLGYASWSLYFELGVGWWVFRDFYLQGPPWSWGNIRFLQETDCVTPQGSGYVCKELRTNGYPNPDPLDLFCTWGEYVSTCVVS